MPSYHLPAVAALAIALAGAAPRQDAALEALRPRFHFTPARNFMNDPNGLVFYKGEYHLFYQHNPFGQIWGHMSWGHAVSQDMLHWQHLPVALAEQGGVMIFSGSAVVDWNNTSGFCQPVGADRSCLVAIYTGHSPGKQTQNLAYSNDRGRTWIKYAANPVVDLGLKDFRDPKVFWHAPTSRWVMATVLADQHKVRFFASPDLKRWQMLSDFGPAGATGGVWECPDLFPLPVDNNSNEIRWVLDVDINPGGVAGGSGGQYFVGSFDGTRFLNENPSSTTLWVDYGKDFYATILVFGHPAHRRPPDLDGVDQQLAVRQRRAHRHLAWRAISPARTGASSGTWRHPSGAAARGRDAGAACVARACDHHRADSVAAIGRGRARV